MLSTLKINEEIKYEVYEKYNMSLMASLKPRISSEQFIQTAVDKLLRMFDEANPDKKIIDIKLDYQQFADKFVIKGEIISEHN